MRKEIVINSAANEIRIAITEEGRLAELFVETPEKERLVGDIYLGKVAKVMPGIQAAFIDVGLPQDAFLHFSDIGASLGRYKSMLGEDSEIDTEADSDEEDEEGGQHPVPAPSSVPTNGEPAAVAVEAPPSRPPERHDRRPRFDRQRRNVNLQKGQDIIVQVTKEPVGKKGVRVTTEASLPGRFLVLLPFDGKVGISKKISSFKEKRRLRKLVRSMLPPSFGVIVRTNAENQDEKVFLQDLESLLTTWREIEKTVKEETAPALLYKDMATTSSVIRDLFSDDVQRVVIDNKKLFKEIRTYVKMFSPAMVEKIEYWGKREPIFDVFGVEKEIATTLARKVWLKSGGYIIVDHTEAMTVIDVNSGRYAAKQDQELNSLKTDLEAAREICRQLRLRDLGGIIVIDFIDILDERNKKKVYDELKKEFRKDRAKVTVLPMTEFCLVQITRQRIRQSIIHSFTEPCPVCGGSGLIQSKTTIVSQIERWIRRFKSESREFRLTLKVHPSLAQHLQEGTISRLTRIRLRFFVQIKLEEDKQLAIDEFKFISRKQDKDITAQYKS
ncbi:MAG TPA: Rne/Rng family ribonuclease [Bacteroidota bacterium]|nr:Rne/Rng family ribonuclease [Bacteroidota bacterium]